jgi:small-conductance mechanosensitive channel
MTLHPIIISLTSAGTLFIAISSACQVIGNRCERQQGTNLIQLWFAEIGSDIRRSGRVVALIAAISVGLSPFTPLALFWGIRLLEISGVIILDAVIVAFVHCWKTWQKNKISEGSLSDKDRAITLTIIPVVANLFKYVLHATAIALVLRVLGADITPLLGASAIAMAVLGFAGQSLLQDIFAFVSLIIDRPYHVGSDVEFIDAQGNGERGYVHEITIRNTIILVNKNGTQYYYYVPNRDAKNFRVWS